MDRLVCLSFVHVVSGAEERETRDLLLSPIVIKLISVLRLKHNLTVIQPIFAVLACLTLGWIVVIKRTVLAGTD